MTDKKEMPEELEVAFEVHAVSEAEVLLAVLTAHPLMPTTEEERLLRNMRNRLKRRLAGG